MDICEKVRIKVPMDVLKIIYDFVPYDRYELSKWRYLMRKMQSIYLEGVLTNKGFRLYRTFRIIPEMELETPPTQLYKVEITEVF